MVRSLGYEILKGECTEKDIVAMLQVQKQNESDGLGPHSSLAGRFVVLVRHFEMVADRPRRILQFAIGQLHYHGKPWKECSHRKRQRFVSVSN